VLGLGTANEGQGKKRASWAALNRKRCVLYRIIDLNRKKDLLETGGIETKAKQNSPRNTIPANPAWGRKIKPKIF